MASQEFVKLETIADGEKFFLMGSIKFFGFSDDVSTPNCKNRFSVRVVYQASDTTVCTVTYYVKSRNAYEAFREQILSSKVTEEQTRKPKDRSYQVSLAAFTTEVRNTMKSMSRLDMSKIGELIDMNRAGIALKWDNGDPVTETALQILANYNEGNQV